MDDIDFPTSGDPEEVTALLTNEFNKTFKLMGLLVNYNRNLFIYKLIKKGKLSKSDAVENSGLSMSSIYNIIRYFEKLGIEP